MNHKKDNIFIVIVTYNGMKWLQKCLDSCKGFSVVVVDNNSSDETVGFIKQHFPEVYLLEQNKNFGFGQANNLGISQALKQGADYVFLLNQDAYLQEGCIENLIRVQKQNPQYGILSPIHLNGEGNRLDKNFSHYVGYRNNPDFYSDFVLKNPLKEIYEVPFVNAAGWLLSREVLETVGGFDPIFFHYGEDDNYCQRVRYHKYKIGVVSDVFLKHDREDRSMTHEYFVDPMLKLERRLKCEYANINKSDIEGLHMVLHKRKRTLTKLFLALKFKKMNAVRQEIDVIKRVLQEITASRKNNLTRGRHYLE